jgi:PAS domain S-box-containing protein
MRSDNLMNKKSKISNKFAELRERSEFLYKLNPVDAGKTSSKEVQELIEELQIHQIELEMQNDELQLAQYELVAARDNYEDLYDSAPVGYLTIGGNGLILNTNFTFSRLVNVERKKIINQQFTDFIAEKDQDIFYVHCQHILDSGKRQTCELELKKNDGKRFYARLDSLTDKTTGEKDNRIKTIVTDINDYKQLEAQLRQSHKMEALGTLAGGIAHEFNNVLHIIGLNLNHLKSKIATESPLWKNVESSQKSCNRAASLIRQILSYSYRSKKQTESIDVIPVIEESVKLVQSVLPAMIKVHIALKVKKAIIKAEEGQIHQIIYNLCSNAGYAMREMGGHLKITVDETIMTVEVDSSHQTKRETFLQLTVVDDGTGIENNVLERIFDPFFTTKPAGDGTGMGLSVVHGIVRNLGGTINVFSKRGQGSTFNVFLPLTEEMVSLKSNVTRPILSGNEQVLIVDDEEGIIDIHTEILEDLGYQVTAVTSSIEALEIFRDQPDKFDMVLTDYGMSNMTGIQLAKKLRLIRNDIPIVLLSGYDNTTFENEAKQIGIRRIVMKPVDHEILGAIIRGVLSENDETN